MLLLLYFLLISFSFQNSFENEITVIRNNGPDIFKGLECLKERYHTSIQDGCKCWHDQPTFFMKQSDLKFICYNISIIRGPKEAQASSFTLIKSNSKIDTQCDIKIVAKKLYIWNYVARNITNWDEYLNEDAFEADQNHIVIKNRQSWNGLLVEFSYKCKTSTSPRYDTIIVKFTGSRRYPLPDNLDKGLRHIKTIEKPSKPSEPSEKNSNIGIIIGIIIFVIIVVLILLFLVWRRQKRKQKGETKQEAKQPLYAEYQVTEPNASTENTTEFYASPTVTTDDSTIYSEAYASPVSKENNCANINLVKVNKDSVEHDDVEYKLIDKEGRDCKGRDHEENNYYSAAITTDQTPPKVTAEYAQVIKNKNENKVKGDKNLEPCTTTSEHSALITPDHTTLTAEYAQVMKNTNNETKENRDDKNENLEPYDITTSEHSALITPDQTEEYAQVMKNMNDETKENKDNKVENVEQYNSITSEQPLLETEPDYATIDNKNENINIDDINHYSEAQVVEHPEIQISSEYAEIE